MCLSWRVLSTPKTPFLPRCAYNLKMTMQQVETILARPEGLAEGFRLWITAEPHPGFPIGLLQIGLKLTNEAPVGIKAGLRASYQWVTQVGASPWILCCTRLAAVCELGVSAGEMPCSRHSTGCKRVPVGERPAPQ